MNFNQYLKTKNIIIFVLIVLGLFTLLTLTIPLKAMGKNQKKCFKQLQQKLVNDGFDSKIIDELYNLAKFEIKGVSLFFVHREAKLDYEQFLSKKLISKAKKYLKKYNDDFFIAEKEYGVDKEVIAAIILVETQLGAYTGKSSVFNILSTISSLSYPDSKNFMWIKIENSVDLNKKDFEKWVNRKSIWAYDELKAFLTYTLKEKIDPLSIKGSYAGAIGIPQFMPSNIIKYGKTAGKDNKIDLLNHSDAILSVANFLKSYGWNKGIDKKKAYNTIFQYNHSEYYVNIILKIAEILK